MANSNFNTDKSIFLEADDRFQRYPFAKRIAETIISNNAQDGIVIGIYGAWGEGKTSVINFISKELENDENVVQIKFNPWRFSDERTLLTNFFNLLAAELDSRLTTGKEKAGEIVKKYSRLLKFDIPVIGLNVGEAAQSVGDFLAEVDVEDLKRRLEEIIIVSSKKLVIFIDDIDRLEKNEIYSIFRLVKLTADFPKTTYILSFDDRVVSAAIGDRFGAGDIESGRNFLEKIIQVPLGLPKAHYNALKGFSFETINNVFDNNAQLSISDDESKRFVSVFTSYFLPKFNTPRIIARYGNAISFSLPLLCGEVNIADLMIIEAMKIAYPDIYYFVKSNQDYFIRERQVIGGYDDSSNESVKKEFDALCTSYTEAEKENIKSLLIGIFPSFVRIFKDFSPNWKKEDLYKHKRIASPRYFNRYFSYAVIKGELSDVMFDEFLDSTSDSTIDEIKAQIKAMVDESSAENFVYKLRHFETEINLEDAKKIAFALSGLIDLFPDDSEALFSDSLRSQIVKFIAIQIRRQSDDSAKVELALSLLSQIESYDFIFDVLNWIQPNDKELEDRLPQEQFKSLWDELLTRIIKECGEQDIYDKFSITECHRISIYWETYDKDSFNKYIEALLSKQPNKVIQLLRGYLPLWHTWGKKSRYGDFAEDQYKYLSSRLDKELINKSILTIFPDLINEDQAIKWRDMGREDFTDIELAKQFRHWYLIDQNEQKGVAIAEIAEE